MIVGSLPDVARSWAEANPALFLNAALARPFFSTPRLRREPDTLGELPDAHLALGQLDVDAHHDGHQMTASMSVRSVVACRSRARITTINSPSTVTPTTSKTAGGVVRVVRVEADVEQHANEHHPRGSDFFSLLLGVVGWASTICGTIT